MDNGLWGDSSRFVKTIKEIIDEMISIFKNQEKKGEFHEVAH